MHSRIEKFEYLHIQKKHKRYFVKIYTNLIHLRLLQSDICTYSESCIVKISTIMPLIVKSQIQFQHN